MPNKEEIAHCTICNKDICKCPTIDRGSFAKYVKRDIIREGIREIFNKYKESREKNPSIDYQDFATQDVLLFLHDNDVVLKVDKSLPVCGLCEGTGLIGGEGINDCCPKCNGTGKIYCVGYVATESLIEEG